MQRYIIGRTTIASSPPTVTTTGRLTTCPIRRIPTWGWLRIGVPKRFPFGPGFVTLNVPPDSSSGEICPAFARAPSSSTARSSSTTDLRSASRTTGTSSPFDVSTATAMWMPFRRIVLSRHTWAFMAGNSRSARAAAYITKGR